METQLKLIPASEHPTALESQWLNAISPADFINNNKNFDVLMMKYRCAIRANCKSISRAAEYLFVLQSDVPL